MVKNEHQRHAGDCGKMNKIEKIIYANRSELMPHMVELFIVFKILRQLSTRDEIIRKIKEEISWNNHLKVCKSCRRIGKYNAKGGTTENYHSYIIAIKELKQLVKQ
ncbi:MAG: hypothetical protein AABY10_02795 [Nanoarchaeota archaeon]